MVEGPDGTTILVGQSTAKLRARLRNFVGQLVLVGGGIIAAAIVGGWFLAGRTLSPIAQITRTAEAISAANLSQRINLRQTESELGRLAKVLNGAFDRLEAAIHSQTAFTADASHELRTPLALIMAQIELALRRERSPQYYQESLDRCLKAARRMHRLVEDLLALARDDANPAPMRNEPLDLGKLVEDTVAMFRPLAESRQVVCHVDAVPLPLVGDADQLAQAIGNLVHNAVEYNRPGGTVAVTARAEADVAVVVVADTGLGIPADDQPHVFERFYRVDKTRSRESGGTGLGLAVAKRIIEMHRGTIALSSMAGQGTTMTIRLPRAADDSRNGVKQA